MYDQEPAYFSNRSLCYLKLKEYSNCIKDCSKAVVLDEKYQKAYFRRMQAREAQCEFILAFKDCQKVLELSSDSEKQNYHKDYDRIHNKIMEEEKKRQKERIKWSRLSKTAKITSFVDKPAPLRSKKPMQKIQVQEKQIPEKIPESIIDKLFNNNTGEKYLEPETWNDSKLFQKNFLMKSKSVDEKLAQKCPEPPKPTSKDDFSIKTEKSDISVQVDPKIEETTKQIVQGTPLVKDDEEKKGESPEKTIGALEGDLETIPSLMELLDLDSDNLPGIPQTGPQFYQDWKELTEIQKFLYLKVDFEIFIVILQISLNYFIILESSTLENGNRKTPRSSFGQ
jgi:hypothetical protein